MIDDRVVPADLAFVDEDRERGGGKGLRRGADLEQRVGVDLRPCLEAADAVAAGERDLAVLDDRDGGARHVRGFACTASTRASKPFGGAASREAGQDEEESGEQLCAWEAPVGRQAVAAARAAPLTSRHTPRSSGQDIDDQEHQASRR